MNTVAAGTHFHFRPQQGVPDVDIWRPLDRSVARWVISHGGLALLAEMAGWASYAEGQGDSALPLHLPWRYGVRRPTAAEVAALAREPLVTCLDPGMTADIHTPFVIELGHLYLRRNCMHERAIADHVRQRRASVSPPRAPVDANELDALFGGQRGDDVQPQREAVRNALGRRLFVLTGGPGTGKTTTVLRMLLALAREHEVRHGTLPVIRLGAPTGKAAQRLNDSLRQGGARLQVGPSRLPDAWQPYLQAALGAESSTLHRLLGSRGRQGDFVHHADNRLPADIVVIDEASMVDLGMLHALLDALPDEAALILVGDADQLTSVGTGSVLLDVVGAIEEQHGDELVRLRHSFRADTALVPINQALCAGDAAAFEEAWGAAGDRVVRQRQIDRHHDLGRLLQAWSLDLRAVLQAAGAFDPIIGEDATAIQRALDALRQQQLLCALRETDYGAEQANDVIEDALRAELSGFEKALWYPGRAVMMTRNDYAFDLLNGDVGLCLMDEHGRLQVWFEGAGGSHAANLSRQNAAFRSFAPGTLPAHQGAFATTVHKSQGSEYERVAVLLPPDTNNPVLSRQLLYTALTRARSRAELWASDDVLQAAVGASISRSTALRLRLIGAQ